jgi:hypothetical protein
MEAAALGSSGSLRLSLTTKLKLCSLYPTISRQRRQSEPGQSESARSEGMVRFHKSPDARG